MKSNNDFDRVLDNATSEIRNENIDSAVVDKAAERVWARLAAETSERIKTDTPAIEGIGDCADFQSLIPAYLTGSYLKLVHFCWSTTRTSAFPVARQ